MTESRDKQVALEATPFYHCYVRCVRRAYLCGDDYATGENYDHRKQWIVSRLRFLSYIYAIDICAYAVMSNHYHAVLHVDEARAKAWSKEEVVERWMQLYSGDVLVDRWLKNPGAIDAATMEVVDEIIEKWRKRLYSLSWFMRGVNETIARMANEEENCKGRFWEGRFKSQALLDEAALLSCMAYVDLNPVRACMADSVESSNFTSVQQRLYDYARDTRQITKQPKLASRIDEQAKLKSDLSLDAQAEAPLMPFDGSAHTAIHVALPFTQEDYFALVDATGRVLRDDKRGQISPEIARIVARYDFDPDKWLDHIQCFGRRYSFCVGASEQIASYAQRFQRRWAKGVRAARRVSRSGSTYHALVT